MANCTCQLLLPVRWASAPYVSTHRELTNGISSTFLAFNTLPYGEFSKSLWKIWIKKKLHMDFCWIFSWILLHQKCWPFGSIFCVVWSPFQSIQSTVLPHWTDAFSLCLACPVRLSIQITIQNSAYNLLWKPVWILGPFSIHSFAHRCTMEASTICDVAIINFVN